MGNFIGLNQEINSKYFNILLYNLYYILTTGGV
jgi:hypothetical protein